MPNKINLIGQKFGLWTVHSESEKRNKSGVFWNCICECGRTSQVPAGHLRSGGSKSCGFCKPGGYKYGESTLRIKRIWNLMMWRCYKPSSNRFNIYGARGIKVCNAWHNYSQFKIWAYENGYSDNLSIDRINVDGNYEPTNCKWSTPKEQSRNKRKTIFINHNGRPVTISELAEENNIKYSILYKRLKIGWDIKRSLTTPSNLQTSIL